MDKHGQNIVTSPPINAISICYNGISWSADSRYQSHTNIYQFLSFLILFKPSLFPGWCLTWPALVGMLCSMQHKQHSILQFLIACRNVWNKFSSTKTDYTLKVFRFALNAAFVRFTSTMWFVRELGTFRLNNCKL